MNRSRICLLAAAVVPFALMCVKLPSSPDLTSVKTVFVLDTPGAVSADSVNAITVDVSWAATGADTFKVFRAPYTPGARQYQLLAKVVTSPYRDLTASPSTRYNYTVTAKNAFGDTSSIDAADAARDSVNTPSGIPTGVRADSVSATSVDVSWTAVAGAANYAIYRAPNSPGSPLFQRVGYSNGSPYRDATASPSGNTIYAVRACFDSDDTSAISASDSVLTPPAAPGTVTPQALSSSTIRLTWTKVPSAGSYIIYRSSVNSTTIAASDATVDTVFLDNGLDSAKTYYYAVSSLTYGLESSRSPVASQKPLAAATTAPDAPSGLAAVSLSSSSVQLTWQLTVSATDYRVWRGATPAGPYGLLSTVTNAQYVDNAVSASTTYYYVVTARNTKGESVYSAEDTATTQAVAQTAPDAPVNVVANAQSSASIEVRWDVAARATSYNVFRKDSVNGSFAYITTITGSPYSDAGLRASTMYRYTVSAVNTIGESVQSTEATATTQAPPQTVPGITTGVNAQALSSNSIKIMWSSTTGATFYRILRSSRTGSGFSEIAAPSASPLTDTGLTASTTYYYRVLAANAVGNSTDTSTEVSAQTEAPPVVKLDKSTSVVASAKSSSNINVNWAAAARATSYKILRTSMGAGAGPFDSVGTTSGISFADAGLTASTAYYYKVVAVNEVGADTSDMVSATTQAPPLMPPATPQNLGVSNASSTTLKLTWGQVTGATSYHVYTALHVLIDSTTATSYIVSGLQPGKSYGFTVTAANTAGESGYATEANGSTIRDVISTPTNLWGRAQGSNAVALNWDPVANASFYVVKRSITFGSGQYDSILSPTTANCIVPCPGPNYTASYVVVAVSGAGLRSGNSNEAQVTTTPGAPLNVHPVGVTSTSIGLAWTPSPGATLYRVYRIDHTLIDSTIDSSYVVRNLQPNSTYGFQVTAVSAAGESPYSGPLTRQTATDAIADPTNLTGWSLGTSSIQLSWDAVASATFYVIKRSITFGMGPYDSIMTSTTAGCVVQGLSPNSTASYVVVAVSGTGRRSGMSNEVQVTTDPLPPDPPADITVSSVGSNSVGLTWTAQSGVLYYIILRRTVDNNIAAGDSIDTTSQAWYQDIGLTENTQYYYAVRSVNRGGAGSIPTAVSALTPPSTPNTPTGLRVIAPSSSEVLATWSPVAGVSSYNVNVLNPLPTVVSTTDTFFYRSSLGSGVWWTLQVAALNGTTASNYCPAESAFLPVPWEVVGPTTSPFSTATATNTDIKVSSNGRVYALATLSGIGFPSGSIYVQRWDGQSWTILGEVPSSGGSISPSLTILNDTPYVAYSSAGNGINVAWFSGASWIVMPNKVESTYSNSYSLSIGTRNYPGRIYVAYSDPNFGGKLTVKQLDRGQGLWNPISTAGFSNGAATDVHCLIDNPGNPLVAFSEEVSAGTNYPKFVQFDGTYFVPHAIGAATSYTDLTLGTNDLPYLIHTDNSGTSNRPTASTWDVNSSTFTSLGMISQGNTVDLCADRSLTTWRPFVAFSESGSGNRLSVKGWDGSQWFSVGGFQFCTPAGAINTSIATDQTDVYVAFSDGANGNKLTVMKHPQ